MFFLNFKREIFSLLVYTATYSDCKTNCSGLCFLINNINGKITKLNSCTLTKRIKNIDI